MNGIYCTTLTWPHNWGLFVQLSKEHNAHSQSVFTLQWWFILHLTLVKEEEEEIKYDMKIVLELWTMNVTVSSAYQSYVLWQSETFHRKIIPLCFPLSSKADWPSSLPPISCILLHQTHLEFISILIIILLFS